MEHLSLETLARLVEDEPTSDETAHLSSCETCASERQALLEQTEALRSLPDLRPPLGDWDVLQARLVSEGLVRRSRGISHLAVTPAWMRGAAAVLIFMGGAAVGAAGVHTAQRGAPIGDDSASGAPRANSPAEAAEVVRVAERNLVEALSIYQEVTEAAGGTLTFSDPASRYAALDDLVAAGQAAVRRAPADPFLNGFLASVMAERQSALRRASTRYADNWFLCNRSEARFDARWAGPWGHSWGRCSRIP
jgi:hypothetical protein